MSDSKSMIYLLRQYADNIATDAELEQLKNLLNDHQQEEQVMSWLTEMIKETESLEEHDEERLLAILGKIKDAETQPASNKPAQVKVMLKHRGWWAAAAIFLMIGSATYFLIKKQPNAVEVAAIEKKILKNDVAPGGNKAVLTLADGSEVVLDSAHNGTITQQGNANVLKLKNGQIAYNTVDKQTGEVVYNTLTTPAGGQYKLLLPDGSEVWLNAASSITYPTSFIDGERKVTITGEAYFEVAHLKDVNGKGNVPFIVSIKATSGEQTQVEVLGTHFNINAYSDEPVIKATLLEGIIKLNNLKSNSMLKPGQQGQVNNNGNIHVIENANTEEAVAWKNGLFQFDNADIKTVMRQIARWYDVDVVFKEMIPSEKFVGEIPRNSNISEVFKILQLSNVHFKIDGKKVIVLP
ncbi:DUF4974 domain-containing protein [soil metagenome]